LILQRPQPFIFINYRRSANFWPDKNGSSGIRKSPPKKIRPILGFFGILDRGPVILGPSIGFQQAFMQFSANGLAFFIV
jgi:hypothetical protein